ncbi:beta-hexosaminidase [Actinobacillus succinogenes]|uniref:Beta-hexosaminidase n=1 Tax=Actinobacillus succinogenes (strain ATCC 55618 / DSM 22257 / CCUG 43843 / 130Z) TaxID=339671 RepID=NAGZ_ACTSZ|nr:beta-N-acetylhexosaminidase [Actinobacillus succinogenes]A6VKU4.1 RecName: Full=Beta-hexosaminidase; AltName: Full=Beta-N-acetylhexosaminidase; AltName: Full=N-acetyl-beta-glucosaminidase [Actinobacillus succinogenes 130Z]ABR73591.1 Beta-N-acetylhexosaminidase [Actinobacillus succinogenes 130Z]PHI39949.1 beta-hexosaminidase [Actinobacillus succinogenes]
MSTLLIDLKGQTLRQEEVELLEHPLVAGLILFTRNFYDRPQIQALVKDIRQRVKKPLLITVDQEGGRVQRFRDGFTKLPAMQSFAALIQEPEQQLATAKEAGWQMAAEMTALDIDLSFAPVLDLGHECKAIGDRSFCSDAESVFRLASAFIDGMHAAGMATTGKHFPGHGHVLADSHLETPFDNRPSAVIFERDIRPFQRLIAQNKLNAVMPAHVIYTDCDDQPASGSKYWLQDILRRKLGFHGAVFSDDLGMKGAGFMGDFVTRSEKALSAGCDLLLLCNEPDGVVQVLDNLKLNESRPHFEARQQRLKTLFKKKSFNWTELTQTEKWLKNTQKLTALQAQWQSS